ncbi:unnamed protein product [Closterium sp. NIES-54]
MGANGGLVGLGNVLLVEGLSANLLSVRRLQKSKAKVTFSPTSCRAKLGKLLLWDLEEKSSCIKDLWQLPIIPWNGKPPATAAAAATAKTTARGEETAPTDGALDAVKNVQQSQQPHGDVLARMAAAGSNVSQMQQCTKIISVLDNSWDNLIPTLNTQHDQWTHEWLRQQILREDIRRRHMVVMHPFTHWVIDSGCTSHMTPRADLLDEVKPPGKIKFVAAASSALLPMIGAGNSKVMGANGGLVGLGNVLLVEGLSANLLSVRRLQKSKAKVTFGPISCRAKLGKLLLWDLEEKSSCIKDLWQLPIIPWNGKPPATAAAAATAKTTAGGEETAPTDGALDAVKKVQQSQQPHGEVLAGVDDKN